MSLRKILGSSSFAIAKTLDKMVSRLQAKLAVDDDTLDDLDGFAEGLANVAGVPVVVLDHNCVVAYLVSAELDEQTPERLEDFELAALARARAGEESIPLALVDLQAGKVFSDPAVQAA